MAGLAGPRRRSVRVGPGLNLYPGAAVLQGPDARAAAHHRHFRRPRAGDARRLGHHRSYLAGGLDPQGQPGRGLSARARRGNHEVMMRGTFGNIRLRNELVPGKEGYWTALQPGGEVATIYDAAQEYQRRGVPLLVIAGKEYGSGSSRDWAAKGTLLLGVKAVIAESYERIHRSNLVGMGVLPLQFLPGEGRSSLGLTGGESYEILGLDESLRPGQQVTVRARRADGDSVEFQAGVRIDSTIEGAYYRHGGVLPYVLRQLLKRP